MAAALFAVGLLSLLTQVLLLREVLVAAFGVEFFALAGLCLWLSGSAAGASWGRRAGPPAAGTLFGPFLALGLFAPLAVAAARVVRPLATPLPGVLMAPGAALFAAALLLLPPAFLSGLLFRRAASRRSPGRGFAGAYAWESLGAVAGGAVAAALTLAGLPNLTSSLGVSVLCAASALPDAPRGRRGFALLLLAAALAALPFSSGWDLALSGRTHPALAAGAETPYGRITVERPEGQTVVFENDALAYESQGVEAETRVGPAALEVEDPRTALLLGGSAEGLLPEVLAHGFARVDVVEMDRRFFDALLPLLPEDSRRAFSAPEVRLVFADPLGFLSRTERRYSFIFSAAPPPLSAQAGRLFTREFFALARRRLAPRGVFATTLATPENLETPLQRRRDAAVFEALRSAFPHVLLLPGPQTLFLGSVSPLVRDPALLASRMAARPWRPRLVSAPYLRYLLTNDRARTLPRLLAAERADAHRTSRPVVVPLTILLYLSRFSPRLGSDPPRLPGPPPPAFLALLVLLLPAAGLAAGLAGRRRPAASALLLAFGWGFAGMVGQTALLLHHAATRGALYRDVGLLLGLFMAGLALGSAWGQRSAALRAFSPLLMASLFGASALLFAAGVASLFLAALLEGAVGLFSGAGFAGAVARGGEARGPSLYAADLLGGAAGALGGSLFLLPFWGLPSSAVLLAALSLAFFPLTPRRG